jgi:hypothetical protein
MWFFQDIDPVKQWKQLGSEDVDIYLLDTGVDVETQKHDLVTAHDKAIACAGLEHTPSYISYDNSQQVLPWENN